MPLSNIPFPEENPFTKIKIRHFIVWFFLFCAMAGFQLGIISFILTSDTEIEKLPYYETIIMPFLIIFCFALSIAWLVRQCRLVGIESKYLIGKIPDNFQWRELAGIAIATSFLSSGFWRISYYLLSFLFPSWINNFYQTSKATNAQNNLFIIIFSTREYQFIIENIYFILLIPLMMFLAGFIIHRLTAKWGKKKSMLALFVFYIISAFPNILGSVTEFILFPFLYLTSRTLLIPVISYLINWLFFSAWNFCWFLFGENNLIIKEDLNIILGLGIIYIVFSLPFIIYFVRKNWYVMKKPLPYFTNKEENLGY